MEILIIFGLLIVYSVYLRYLKKHNPDLIKTISKKLHWPMQLLPPLFIFSLITTNGPGLWFSMAALIFVILFSGISLFHKLITYKKNKIFLLRPVLSILFVSVVFGLANYSLGIAEKQAHDLAETFQMECKVNKICPKYIQNWKEIEANKTYVNKVGRFIKYPVTYSYLNDRFSLYLHQSLDLGKMYTGGITRPINIVNLN